MKIDIKSMTLAEIKAAFQEEGLPAFRSLQVYRWLHRGVESFEEMSDLSRDLRQKLSEKYYISVANIEKSGFHGMIILGNTCFALPTVSMWSRC